MNLPKLEDFNTVQTDKIFAIVSKSECIDIISDILTPENKNNINLISILDPDDENSLPHDQIKDFNAFLEVKFWDVEEDIGKYKSIREDQAKEIKTFILENKDKPFLIHCAAGMSRSAGIGCAVECLLNYNSRYEYSTGHSDIFPHSRYSPNLTVYDKITKV